MSKLSRRQFLAATAGTAAATLVPRHVLGGPGYVPPSDLVNIGYVGCGSQGLRLLMEALGHPEINIVAVCDPNRGSDDYPTWGPGEIKGKIRGFLEDPTWGEGKRDGTCGREVGQELVNRHNAKLKRSGTFKECGAYADFREMLAQEQDLDAVYIMTPDHMHTPVALYAMRAGKHAITHKSAAVTLHEARLLHDTAKETGVATHMYCASDSRGTPQLIEWLAAGAIGPVREVHNWTDRPYWPQGMYALPSDPQPVPDGLDWSLWQGVVPERPYHPSYTHARFRGWVDYGSGTLGDVASYSFHQIFSVMQFGIPDVVEAFASRFYSIKQDTWHREVNMVSYPESCQVRWDFPARGDMPPARLYWYDGGMRPYTPEILEKEGVELNRDGGLMFVGDDGILIGGWREPRLYPSARAASFTPPEPTLPRLESELDQFVHACKGGPATNANFMHIRAQLEAVLIGNVAMRVPGKLRWNSEQLTFADSPDATKLVSRAYRDGWTI